MNSNEVNGASRTIAATQGAIFVATGVWPIVHMRSFEAVTGRKSERWIVRTMGALIASVGAGLLAAARAPTIARSTRTVAVLSACVLGAADVWYVTRGRISRVYLVDAALEAGIVAAWLLASRSPARAERARPLLERGRGGSPMNKPFEEESVIQHAKDVAQKTASDARRQLGQQAEHRKHDASARLGHVAEALRETGRHLSEDDDAGLSGYADRAAEQVERVSEYFRSRTIGDLVGDVERFARREPAIFLGGAMALGLAAARFLKSSARHEQYETSPSTSSSSMSSPSTSSSVSSPSTSPSTSSPSTSSPSISSTTPYGSPSNPTGTRGDGGTGGMP